jgi:exodeoxyribonuclease-3
MKIISWNVNGIRANIKKGGFEWLLKQNADIFCLQETKAHPEQLDGSITQPKGYHVIFDHSRTRKGYSGVAIYSKIVPRKVEYSLDGVSELDQEGRLIIAYFDNFCLLNVYFPNGGGGEERLRYKMAFYKAFLKKITKINKAGIPVVFCGDINTAHQAIDLARPKENEKNTGFLPEERAWIDDVIQAGFIDVFRTLFPEKKEVYTYWDMKTFARERNVGWRIDYFFISSDLKKKVKSSKVYSDIFGSDHCPLDIEIDL